MIIFGNHFITIDNIVDIAYQRQSCELNRLKSFEETIRRGATLTEQLFKNNHDIYGVTTGYGDSFTVSIPFDLIEELPTQLVRYHGCGMGDNFNAEIGRAVLAVRLTSLCQGYSGVGWELLNQLIRLIQLDAIPVIPSQGSVGASGDLTPLSYIAAVLMGERKVYFQNAIESTEDVFQRLNLSPLKLKPKEALAIMNGTSVMTALACIAFRRAEYLSRLSCRIAALMVLALKANACHFDEKLFSLKPHPGQMQAAKWIRQDLTYYHQDCNCRYLQDRYSIRCAPHIIGVLQDALTWMKSTIEQEINSANDNPLIDPTENRVMHGGHFYGGHIAFAMDSLKNCVANIADLLDRQMALLVDAKYNNGLPPNLSGATGERKAIHHGLKAVQIACSAWTAEALMKAMPSSAFSRSTECHNQDKVSMGTIAARQCLEILFLTEQVASACLIAVFQAIELRFRQNELTTNLLTENMRTMRENIFQCFSFIEEDYPLESPLRQITSFIQQQAFEIK
jgi:histidine ammonia-lyase